MDLKRDSWIDDRGLRNLANHMVEQFKRTWIHGDAILWQEEREGFLREPSPYYFWFLASGRLALFDRLRAEYARTADYRAWRKAHQALFDAFVPSARSGVVQSLDGEIADDPSESFDALVNRLAKDGREYWVAVHEDGRRLIATNTQTMATLIRRRLSPAYGRAHIHDGACLQGWRITRI